jgi:hypothetical protein
MKKIIRIVRRIIKIIINGFINLTPEIIPMENPIVIRKIKLSKRVKSRP